MVADSTLPPILGPPSSSHEAYVAITVHLECEEKPMAMLLDIVEVPKLHTSVMLTCTFTQVLDNFGINEKVR